MLKPQVLETAISEVQVPYLPCYSVLVCVRKSLTGVDLDIDRAQHSPALAKSWREFVLLVKDFMDGFQIDHESPNRIVIQLACDNIQCAHITEREAFRTCAGCETTHYCCTHRQHLDWKRGHRETCAKIRSHALNKAVGPASGMACYHWKV
ncbi:hypothetical protein FB45DRAFT_230250 [Roridomyces roridus]|uniref:MYND-type domain-containing protein n=1 Tax=Roridomyces roridus TaxID=1738132 RepID=A0AAD7BC74_9AGAR|nr:hypothetical protein FB45DRAFT_230250 [Roridomyces roridus]